METIGRVKVCSNGLSRQIENFPVKTYINVELLQSTILPLSYPTPQSVLDPDSTEWQIDVLDLFGDSESSLLLFPIMDIVFSTTL